MTIDPFGFCEGAGPNSSLERNLFDGWVLGGAKIGNLVLQGVFNDNVTWSPEPQLGGTASSGMVYSRVDWTESQIGMPNRSSLVAVTWRLKQSVTFGKELEQKAKLLIYQTI